MLYSLNEIAVKFSNQENDVFTLQEMCQSSLVFYETIRKSQDVI